mmetsp:Transcript_64993/g.89310  ORF Transcript_64993/g.89310 Transcript_64993/m.89310 type:complete len:209 (-) Transcript_64993:461-1087(-)
MFGGRSRKPQQNDVKSTAALFGGPPSLEGVVVSDREAAANFVFIRFCLMLSYSTRLAGLCAVVCNMIMMSYSWSSVVNVTIRCYGIVFGVAVICTEFEIRAFFRFLPSLESWICRGIFLIFEGVLIQACMLLDNHALRYMNQCISVYLVFSGGIYFTMGVLCFHKLKVYQLGKAKRKKLMQAEMSFLSAQKEEIERLLVDTESKLQNL